MLCNHMVRVTDKKARSGRAWILVPCGRCIACRLNKARGWALRIMHEAKEAPCSCFVTLTYSDENLPKNGSLSVEDCQKFFKRLRKNTGRKFRYFLGGEYGEIGGRPHYHAILFSFSKADRNELERAWGLGHIRVDDVSVDRAQYVAGYTLKKLTGDSADNYSGRRREFGLMSRRPGIGAEYLEKYGEFTKQNGFCVVKGNKVGLPRFYSERLYITDEEKNQLREKRQAVIDEGFEKSRVKAQLDGSRPYLVSDYSRTERAAGEADLIARHKMKRRTL